MPGNLARWINRHEYPDIFYRIPGLLPLQWLTTRILYHRCWLIHRTLKGTLRTFDFPISYLDAGCGSGDFLVPLARKNRNSKFSGLDKSAANLRMINIYTQKKKIHNVNLISLNLENKITLGSFDIILAASVLHYVHDTQALIQSFADHLRPGGKLIIYVPVNYRRFLPGYSWIRSRIMRDVDYDADKKPNEYLSLECLSAELHRSGLQIEKERYLYGKAGQVVYEITSMSLLLIQKLPWFLAIPLILIYFPLVQPLMLVLAVMDYLLPTKHGNGLLLVARKDQIKRL